MAVQWPQVKAWLVATIPALPGLSDVQPYAGPRVTGDAPLRYVTVGYVADDLGGSYQQVQSYDGTVWDETGEVRSQIVARSGDSDPTVSEADAFAIADALDAAIRANRTLGGLLAKNAIVETVVEVASVGNTDGNATALIHTLRYTTTT